LVFGFDALYLSIAALPGLRKGEAHEFKSGDLYRPGNGKDISSY
jgi:hypothetical protein